MKDGGHMIVRLFFVLFCFVSLELVCWAQKGIIDLGTVETDGGRKVFRLDFGGTDAVLINHAKAAFRLHGAYANLPPASKGDFSFEFRSVGNGLLELQISTGIPRRSLLRKIVRGPDAISALLHACDEAVLATTGISGFFSGKLAYISDLSSYKEIYLVDPLFLRAKNITKFRSICFNPSWSSDGKGIFFTSTKSKSNDVFFMDTSTRKHRAVARYKGSNLSGVQSPVGRKVAYILSASGNPELWLADIVGARPRQLTKNNSNESGPCWSPDGQRMIITSDISGKPQLYEVSLSNGKLNRIPTSISRHCSEATWNPRNPNRIVFTAAVAGGFQLAEYDFSRRKSRWLTSGSADSLQPEWANDGRHVFFTERSKGSSRLMIIDAGSDEEAANLSSPSKVKPVKLHNNGYGNPSQPTFFYK